MLRLATPDDIPIIVDFVQNVKDETQYSKIFKDLHTTEAVVKLFVDPSKLNQKACVLAVNESNEPVGFIAFETVIDPVTELHVARMVIVYVKPEYRNQGYMSALFGAFEHWGKKVGAKYYYVGISREDVDLTDKGYEKYEVVYMKEIT